SLIAAEILVAAQHAVVEQEFEVSPLASLSRLHQRQGARVCAVGRRVLARDMQREAEYAAAPPVDRSTLARCGNRVVEAPCFRVITESLSGNPSIVGKGASSGIEFHEQPVPSVADGRRLVGGRRLVFVIPVAETTHLFIAGSGRRSCYGRNRKML